MAMTQFVSLAHVPRRGSKYKPKHYTVQFCFNTVVSFLQNSHNGLTISRTWGQIVCCTKVAWNRIKHFKTWSNQWFVCQSCSSVTIGQTLAKMITFHINIWTSGKQVKCLNIFHVVTLYKDVTVTEIMRWFKTFHGRHFVDDISNPFSCTKMAIFLFKFHWGLFVMIQWHGAEAAPNHLS